MQTPRTERGGGREFSEVEQRRDAEEVVLNLPRRRLIDRCSRTWVVLWDASERLLGPCGQATRRWGSCRVPTAGSQLIGDESDRIGGRGLTAAAYQVQYDRAAPVLGRCAAVVSPWCTRVAWRSAFRRSRCGSEMPNLGQFQFRVP